MRERRVQGPGVALAIVAMAGFFLILLATAALILPPRIYPLPSDSSLAGYPPKERVDLVNTRLTLQNSVRGPLIQGVIGSMVLFTASVGGFVTLRQVRVANEAQLADRFTKAIGQLGDDNLDVRVGAIWALERLATNSPIDKRAIAQVLNAFVRRRVPWSPHSPSSLAEGQQAPDARPASDDDQTPLPRRVPDVQAAMEVLGQEIFIGSVVLPFVDLHVAALAGARLAGSVFQEANLAVALLRDADLRRVVFTGANLHGAILDGSNLVEANLAGADLTLAKLRGADLTAADLTGADLRGADLYRCKLEGAELTRVHADPTTRWPDDVQRERPAGAGDEP